MSGTVKCSGRTEFRSPGSRAAASSATHVRRFKHEGMPRASAQGYEAGSAETAGRERWGRGSV